MYSMSPQFLYPLELYGIARISEITESHTKNLQTLRKPLLLQSLCIYSIYYFVQWTIYLIVAFQKPGMMQ